MEVVLASASAALVGVMGYLAHGHTQLRVMLAEILVRLDAIENHINNEKPKKAKR